MNRLSILLVAAAFLMAGQSEAQLVRTTVAQGEIEGVVEEGMVHYKGIPFAEPPVGNLRWKAPVPAKTWEGTFKADHFAKQGVQRVQTMPGQEVPAVSEDCLYLNVLTPAKSKDEKLPVLVWIHGGAFSSGNSFTDGSNFAKAGIVFVSITYRLNCMGFLSLPELTQESIKETGHATSGNYGIMDQILALQWVHDNIAAFGGDPAKVTIMGESAGAISVAILCQSPLAKGLFRGAISESGGNMVPMDNVRIDNNSLRNVKGSEAYGLAFIQRVTGKKNPKLKDLRKLPAEVFLNDSAAFSMGGALWPCYDDYILDTDAYLQYQKGNFNDVNILMGTNSDEGSMFTGYLGEFTPVQYEEELRISFAPEWRDEFRKMYPGSNNQEAFDAHSDIFREAAFAWPTYAWANMQSQHGKGNVYMYFFDQLKFNPFRRNQQTTRKQISTHAFEMMYTFGPQRSGGWGGPQSPADAAMTKIIHQYWVNFIKTGDPNGELLPYWPAYNQGTESTMYFRDGAFVTELPNLPQLELWTRYFDWRREHLTEYYQEKEEIMVVFAAHRINKSKNMNRIITLGAALMALAACTPKENVQNDVEGRFITVSGHDLVKPDGEKFFIQGINLGNWINPEGYMFRFGETSSYRLINQMFCELTGEEFTANFWNLFKENYITEADIHYIAQTGMNTLRIPFHYKLFTDEYYMGRNDSTEGFRLIDRVVNWCRTEGLRVILDMHDAPGGQTGDNIDDSYGYPWLLESEMQQQRCCDIWLRIAEHYANDTIVIGYDLLNEPIAPYEAEKLPELNAALEPLYMRITQAIRTVDKNHIVMLGGAQWNGNFTVFKDSKFDDKMMYTCHRYWCDTTTQAIADFLHFRDSVNLPMYMGETGENTDEWIHGFTRAMESQNIGWTYWPYKKMAATSCMKQIKMPENWELIRAYAASDRGSFKKIRENKVSQEVAKAAMNELLENAKFENCLTNEGYIWAMGMKP